MRREFRYVFGRHDSPNPLQLVLRFFMFAVVVVPTLGLVSTWAGTNTCYPNCVVTQAQVDRAQNGARSAGRRETVVVYGDSRAWFFAEGAKLVPGWVVTNRARQGCPWLGQGETWTSYYKSKPVDGTTAKQRNGQRLKCDTRSYIAGSDAPFDIAIIYAGTLLSVDVGTDRDVHSPLEPGWRDYLEQNLVDTISRINAHSIVLLSTPPSRAIPRVNIDAATAYWSHQDRIDAVNGVMADVARRAGVTYFLNDFAPYVDSLPRSCQPDGAHLTVDCATRVGEWIKAHLGAAG
jgi:hypothetical protein